MSRPNPRRRITDRSARKKTGPKRPRSEGVPARRPGGGNDPHTVPEWSAGKTLETFLRRCLAGGGSGSTTAQAGATAEAGKPLASWSSVRRLVRRRRIMVDGNICTDGARRLRGGEVVKILAAAAPAPPDPADLRIVYLDEHCVVVEKPPGITTVRHREERSWPARRRQLQPTLDELLPLAIAREVAGRRSQERRLAQGKSGNGPREGATPGRSGPDRPARLPRTSPVFAVHRIDRETSGLVVFARTIPAARILAEQFRVHDTHRRYLAIVAGRPKTATIRSHLLRDRGDGRRGSAEEGDGEDGKLAITHVRTLERLGPAHSLVECRLETGRTHQIRIHLSEAGHPLLGEKVYRTRRRGRGHLSESSDPPVGRVALHAAELGFVHPASGEPIHLESPLPRDLRDLVRQLQGRG